MREERVFFMAGDTKIEGLYASSDGERGVVVSHPHPLMGGAMSNNVVDALVSGFFNKGFSTLRFNFRGVGRSEGAYDDGNAEQDDLMGAVSYLAEQGKKDITLAGYSFGAWITAKVVKRHNIFSEVILVSPPIDFLDFDFAGLEGRIGLIVSGDYDQFSSTGRLKSISGEVGCRFDIVRGADHFYFGREYHIIERIYEYLSG